MMKLVVFSCLMAAASAGLLGAPFAPFAYSAAYLSPYNYRGPLSLAPGQPANILAADGRPLDTLEVNLDRSAHYTAKALNGVHLLKKRSAPLIAPVAPVAPIALSRSSLIAPALSYSASPFYGYAGPISGYASPITGFASPISTYASPFAYYK